MAKAVYIHCSCGRTCRVDFEKPSVECWKCGRTFYICSVCTSNRNGNPDRCGTCAKFSNFVAGDIPFPSVSKKRTGGDK